MHVEKEEAAIVTGNISKHKKYAEQIVEENCKTGN